MEKTLSLFFFQQTVGKGGVGGFQSVGGGGRLGGGGGGGGEEKDHGRAGGEGGGGGVGGEHHQPLFSPAGSGVVSLLPCRAGHLRYFLFLSLIKNDFFAFFIKLMTYFCTSPI